MATAKATLIGFHKYNENLFSKLVLPEGIEKELFISTLLLKAGEFEVLYADPEFMENAIGVWGSKWFRTFSEWLRGTQSTWNPIHNYDRNESITDSGSRSFGSKKTADYTDARTANLQDQTTFNNTDTTSQLTDSTTEHEVSAYDAATYQPSSKDIINNGSSNVAHTGTITNGTTGTDDIWHKGTLADETGTESHSDTHTAHVYGNIGVTQASDMLRGFYDISAWNLYDHMADVFTQELLIPVYS